MTPSQFVDRALSIPYREGAAEWAGADCWGLVELFYAHVLGVKLIDRANIAPGHAGMNAGFDAATDWPPVSGPVENGLVIMRAAGFKAGHVGLFIAGRVLHTSEKTGCVYQPITDRFLRSRITSFLRHSTQ